MLRKPNYRIYRKSVMTSGVPNLLLEMNHKITNKVESFQVI